MVSSFASEAKASANSKNGTAWNSDLMISFRQEDGNWSKPENLGERLELESGKLGTTISPDGKFLFFLGQIDGIRGAVWVEASVIEGVKGE
jgi:hypothetical protein